MNKVFLNGSIFVILAVLVGCNLGGGGQSITATSNNCVNMESGVSTCSIKINFNNNGTSNIIASYTPNPLPLGITSSGTFGSTFNACVNKIARTTGSDYCDPITFTYNGSTFPMTYIRFVLNPQGSIPIYSNPISVSGR